MSNPALRPGMGGVFESLYSDAMPVPDEEKTTERSSRDNDSRVDRSSIAGLASPKTVAVSAEFTSIDDIDFLDSDKLTDLDLSKTRITTISKDTFYACETLASIILPATVKTIEESAFLECTNLKKVTFAPGSSLMSIGLKAFYASGIRSLVLPSRVKLIEEEAFGECDKLTSLIISKRTEVHPTAFIGCTRLPHFMLANLTWMKSESYGESFGEEELSETLIISDDVSEEKYRGNDTIRFVKVKYGVEHIAFGAFEGCTSLETIELPRTLLTFGNHVFRGCKSLQEINIPDSVEIIQKELFSDCVSLQKVILSSSTKYIYEKAFENCESLDEISLPTSLKDIEDAVFKNCSSLKSITVPQSVTFFGTSMFEGCVELEKVKFEEGISITQIKERSFFQCRALNDCKLPISITAIGHSAFFECESLRSLSTIIHEGITLIDNYAFASCSSIESLRIPRSTKLIGTRAFRGCTSLRQVTILNPNIEFVFKAFSRCIALEHVKGLPEDKASIQDILDKEIFYICPVLETPLGNEIHLAAEGKCWVGDEYPEDSHKWIEYKLDELNRINPTGDDATFIKDYNGDTAFQCAVRGGAPMEMLKILVRGTDVNGKTHLDLFAEKNARIDAEDYTEDEIDFLKAVNNKLISATKIGEGVNYLNSFVELLGSAYFDPRTVPEFIEKLNAKFETRTFAAILMLDVLMPFVRVLAYTKASVHYFDEERPPAAAGWYAAIYISLCYVIFREFLQVRDGFLSWVTDFWNMMDMFVLFNAFTTAYVMQNGMENGNNYMRDYVILMTFFIWNYAILKLKVLSVNFAIFVSGIINIIWTLVPFMAVSLIVLGAFAQMYLLANMGQYETFWNALLFTYGELLAFNGIPDGEEGDDEYKTFRMKTIASFYGFFVVVLLLNVVIAVASTAWEGVTERGRDEFLLYRTKLFLELQDIFIWMRCLNIGKKEDKHSLSPDANYHKLWKDSKTFGEVMRRVKKEGVGLVARVALYGIHLIFGIFFGLTWPKPIRKRLFSINNHEAISDKRSELASLLKEEEEDLERLEKIDKHIQNKIDDEFLHLVDVKGIPSRFELKKKIRDTEKKILRLRKDVRNFKRWETSLRGGSKKKLFNYNEFITKKES